MQIETIFCIPLSELTAMDADIDEYWLTQLIAQIPELGKETDRYYLINNNLTINNFNNEHRVVIFNNFVMRSQQKGQLLQLIKSNNEQKQDEQVAQTTS